MISARNRLSALGRRLDLSAWLGPRQGVPDERTAAARSRRQGIIGLVLIVAALAATAAAYLNPSGQSGYSAHLTNSAGVRAGDQVRIAGITVGTVTGVRLDGALVEMTFDVERSVKVGSDSTLDVKLLTPLGGHYVALDPKGAMPLGRNVIPPQRVSLPFEVNDIIQAATPVIKEVDGQVIHDTFAEVANAAGKYPDAIRNLLQSANDLTASLSSSATEFHRSLSFVADGMGAMVAGRKQLVTVFQQLDILGKGYTAHSVDIIEFFGLVKELARIMDRLTTFYARELAPVINGLDDIIDHLYAHPDQLGKAADAMSQAMNIVVPMLSGNGVVIDKGNQLVPGQDLCLPNIMRNC